MKVNKYNIRQIVSVLLVWSTAILVANHVGYFGLNTAQPISLMLLVLPVVLLTSFNRSVAGFLSIFFAFAAFIVTGFGLLVTADIFALYAYFFLIVILLALVAKKRLDL